MKLSVILPCYNVGRFVGLCLDSLAEAFALASMDDYEIIVVDDGSSDDTADVVMQSGCKNLRLFKQENCGVSGARNRGLAEAHGRWVWFVDPDDTVVPDILQKISHLLDSSYQAIAFTCAILMVARPHTVRCRCRKVKGIKFRVSKRYSRITCKVLSVIPNIILTVYMQECRYLNVTCLCRGRCGITFSGRMCLTKETSDSQIKSN